MLFTSLKMGQWDSNGTWPHDSLKVFSLHKYKIYRNIEYEYKNINCKFYKIKKRVLTETACSYLPSSLSSRILVAFWWLFVLILGKISTIISRNKAERLSDAVESSCNFTWTQTCQFDQTKNKKEGITSASDENYIKTEPLVEIMTHL